MLSEFHSQQKPRNKHNLNHRLREGKLTESSGPFMTLNPSEWKMKLALERIMCFGTIMLTIISEVIIDCPFYSRPV